MVVDVEDETVVRDLLLYVMYMLNSIVSRIDVLAASNLLSQVETN